MSEAQSSLLPMAREEISVPAVVTVPATQELLDRVTSDLSTLQDIAIDSELMAEVAVETLGRVATVREAMDAERLSKTKPYREAQGKINGGYNPALEFIDKIVKKAKEALTTWNRKVAEEKRRLEREAEKRARAGMEAGEAQRQAKEREARELLDRAKQAAASGETDLANALMSDARAKAEEAQADAHIAAVSANAPTLGSGIAGVKGATVTWHAAVESLEELILGVADELKAGNRSNINALEASMVFINKKASIEKENFRLRGCKPVQHEGVRVAKRAV